ncbi:hypothetical protein GP5015_2509 [gamma proteobacterium HTCC5015]|nr:hypothetical protein GP5015_2509 [gamma proteobacterium HTCC5015]
MTRRGTCYCAPVVAPAQAGAQWLYYPHSLKDAGFPPARE